MRKRLQDAGLAALAAVALPLFGAVDSTSTVAYTSTGPPVVNLSASSGAVRARIDAIKQDERATAYELENLRIYRAGRLAFDGRLPQAESTTYSLGSSYFDVLAVRELDRDNEPEAIVTIYTGGAHCCTRTVIYGYVTSTGTYHGLVTDWGNGGYDLKNLGHDRYPAFLSEDDLFAYAFASYAGSGRPLRIMRYREGELIDVTRCYPARIREQAQSFWKSAVEQKKDPNGEPNGVLAPYVADEYLLGNGAAALSLLARFPSADTKFKSDLMALLKQGGYLSTKAPDCKE